MRQNVFSLNIWRILFFSSIFILIYVLFYNLQYRNCQLLFLLPLSFFISINVLKKLIQSQLSLAFSIILIGLVCRYLILPFFWANDSSYTGYVVGGVDYNEAAIMISYECVAVSVFIRLFSNYLFSTEYNQNVFIEKPKIISWVIVLIFVSLALTPTFSQLLFNFAYAELTGSEEEGIDYLQNAFWNLGKNLIPIILWGVIYRLYKQGVLNSFVSIILMSVVSLLYLSSCWLSFGSVSRWPVIVASLQFLYCLMLFYPNRKKRITIGGIGLLIVVIVGGSMVKLTSIGEISTSTSDATDFYVNSEMFDEYFSGIGPVANGIRAADAQPFSPHQWYFDMFHSFPGACRIAGINAVNEVTGTRFFREYVGRMDFIVPNVTMSYQQVGVWFSPLYSIILAFIALGLDKIRRTTRYYTIRLLLFVPIFYSALFMGLNVNIAFDHYLFAIFGVCFFLIENKFLRNNNDYVLIENQL